MTWQAFLSERANMSGEKASLRAVNAGNDNSGQRLSRVLQGCVEQIQFLQPGTESKAGQRGYHS